MVQEAVKVKPKLQYIPQMLEMLGIWTVSLRKLQDSRQNHPRKDTAWALSDNFIELGLSKSVELTQPGCQEWSYRI